MNDPYGVLGLDSSASDEEVKRAYRELAKRYHPDNYSGTESAEFASEMMKKINDAYDEIMRRRKKVGGEDKTTQGDFGYVRSLISDGKIEEAQVILNEVPTNQRDAEWYFLTATIFYKRGWLQEAMTNFTRACTMDPSNREYRAAFQEMQRQRSGNVGGYNPVAGTGCGCSLCDICTSLMCADCCCECMGGDCIRCC